MNNHNLYARRFLQHVRVEVAKHEPSVMRGSVEHLIPIDLTDKIILGPVLETVLNHDYSTAKLYRAFEGRRYGLDDHVYPHLIQFTSFIASLPLFKERASEEFVLETTFNWIIDSYINGNIGLPLMPHLLYQLEQEIVSKVFHFPVLNLHIEAPFQIGKTTFQYFAKDYFEKCWSKLDRTEDEKQEMESVYSKYFGVVFISCAATAEKRKAEELAYRQACLSMDVFRLFSPAVSFPLLEFKVDLERRININFSSEFLVEVPGSDDIHINKKMNNQPHYFSRITLDQVSSHGLIQISNFIYKEKQDDLYKVIIHSITFFSFALSISDLHLRISQLIMIIEGLLLEESYIKESMQKRVKRRFCKLICSTDAKKSVQLLKVLEAMYEVRHAITHKGHRLLIDKRALEVFQPMIVELIKKLVELNETIKTKDQLIKYIEQP